MSNIALRTRFSAQRISALSSPPLFVLHAIVASTAFAFPLFVAIVETPVLLLLVWPFLVIWIMLIAAAREEVAELPQLYADAMVNRDDNAVRELGRLSHLAGVDLAGARGFALATAGRYEEARTLLEAAKPGALVERARRVLSRATPFRG